MPSPQGEGLSRRAFLSGAALVGAGVATAGFAGCAPQSQQEPDAPSASSQATPSSEYGFETAPAAISEADIAETVEADVIVVGSGHSGLCTALSVIEQGGHVILISASSTPIARGGSNNAVYSKYMKRVGLPAIDVEYISKKELMATSSRVDQRKWYKYFNNSEESMNWLIDVLEGAGLQTAVETGPVYPVGDPFYTPHSAHGWLSSPEDPIGMTQPLVVNALASILEEKGGRIDYNTIGRQLVRGGVANGTTGRVEGIIAQASNGSYIKYVGTKAVVLATGDFSLDREMMEKFCPEALPYCDAERMEAETNYDNGFTTGGLYKGDGQKMGLWVGAAWQNNPHATPMFVAAGSATAKAYAGHWGLKLNAEGQRFMNEDCPGAYSVFSVGSQTDSTAFCIWDDAYADGETDWNALNTTFDAAPLTTEEVKATWMDSHDTLEEAINSLGLPLEETLATIERYNELCDTSDADFHKDSAKMKAIRTPPFHTGTEVVYFYTVMGGLRTNENMQVCDENNEAIPGLYNVGTMVGDMYANIYTFMIEGFNYGATCLTFGRMTGAYVMEHE